MSGEGASGQASGSAALSALLTRRSVPAEYLSAPGPGAVQIASAIDAALRAPDHGRVQPWRFRLVQGAARAVFGELLVTATLAREPASAATQLDKLRSRVHKAPLVIVASALLRSHPKVPESEQLLSAGAGVMNLLNAFHAQGFGAIWLTGPNAYDPAVARALGCADAERLLGFLYVGSVAPGLPSAPARPAQSGFVSDWRG